MKKVFLILLLAPVFSYGQRMIFMLDKSATTGGGGTPSTIRVEAEAFDSYSGIAPETNGDNDASLYDVGYIDDGDYAIYTINPAASGNHQVSIRHAGGGGGLVITFKSADGSTTYGSATLPATASYSTWQTDTYTINFPSSGTQQVRLEFTAGGFNFSYFEIDNSYVPVITKYAFINFVNPYVGNTAMWPTNVSYFNLAQTKVGTDADIQTAGGWTMPWMQTQRLLKITWTLTNTSAVNGSYSAPQAATDGNGVFTNQEIGYGWSLNNGAQLTIGGLDQTKTYDIFYHSNIGTGSGQSTSVSFTANGVTSASINPTNNIGDHTTYPNWQNDPAIIKSAGVTPNGSGNIVVTANGAGGIIPLNVMVIKQN